MSNEDDRSIAERQAKVDRLRDSVEKLDSNIDGMIAKWKVSVGTLGQDVENLRKYGRNTRAVTVALCVALIFDLVLTVIVGATTIEARHAADTATRAAAQAQIAAASAEVNAAHLNDLCTSNNSARADNSALWAGVIAILTPSNPTPAEVRAIGEIQAKVDSTFAPRDCDVVAPKESTSPTSTPRRPQSP